MAVELGFTTDDTIPSMAFTPEFVTALAPCIDYGNAETDFGKNIAYSREEAVQADLTKG